MEDEERKRNVFLHSRKQEWKEDLNCELCEFQTSSTESLKTHKDLVHKEFSYQCDYDECPYQFTEREHLEEHEQSHHLFVQSFDEEQQKSTQSRIKFQCDQCEYKAPFKSHLRIHKESVHYGIKHKCSICYKQFSARSTLVTHIKVAHEGKKHHCRHCHHRAISRGHLRRHYHAKHRDKDIEKELEEEETTIYQCNVCGRKYRKESYFRKHKAEHSDKKF